MLPNFFVIGAAKSGTTSLHDYLGQHPQIYMSPVKEPNFFSFLGNPPDFNGPNLASEGPILKDRLHREKYAYSIVDWKAYEHLFARAGEAAAIGESSVSYMYFPDAARNIKAHVPDPRFVAILRNPVDRAFSKYKQFVRDASEPLSSFDLALAAEDERKRENWSPTWFYKDRGFYCRQLRRYYDLFGRDRIFVTLFDDFSADPKQVCRQIFDFLGVEPSFEIDDEEQHNVSGSNLAPRNVAMHYLIMRPNPISNAVRQFTPAPLLKHVRRAALLFAMKPQHDSERPILRAETRESLKRLYRQDIEQLSSLIGRDLRHWL